MENVHLLNPFGRAIFMIADYIVLATILLFVIMNILYYLTVLLTKKDLLNRDTDEAPMRFNIGIEIIKFFRFLIIRDMIKSLKDK